MQGMTSSPPLPWKALRVVAVLSLAAAVSLGITRFAYGLLLPPMRADLGWSYTLAGAMNTANATGYLLGALMAPWLMRRFTPARVLLWGSALAAVFMAASGFFDQAVPLLVQRLLAGVASAWVFVAGGLLAARLGSEHASHAGLLLGVFYGGVGWGIALSAVAVPVVLTAHAHQVHGWAWAWWWLALACGVATFCLVWPVQFFKKNRGLPLSNQAQAAIKNIVSYPARPPGFGGLPPAHRIRSMCAVHHPGRQSRPDRRGCMGGPQGRPCVNQLQGRTACKSTFTTP